jgi:hypothetical protein
MMCLAGCTGGVGKWTHNHPTVREGGNTHTLSSFGWSIFMFLYTVVQNCQSNSSSPLTTETCSVAFSQTSEAAYRELSGGDRQLLSFHSASNINRWRFDSSSSSALILSIAVCNTPQGAYTCQGPQTGGVGQSRTKKPSPPFFQLAN